MTSAEVLKNPAIIHVVGSTNVDFVVRTAALPRAGETIGGGTFTTVPGGKGANQALAAGRLGADVKFHSSIGDDAYAQIALANLIEAGVDITGVVTKPNVATGAAFINVDDNGENQIAVASGANAAFAPSDVTINGGDGVIAQLEVPPETILSAVQDNDIFFCLNTAPAIDIPAALIHRANLLVMNETESNFYEPHLADFRGIVVRTYGAKGAALFRNGAEVARATPPEVSVIDTTGAGDTFTAALTLALVKGESDENALRFACVAGALATTKLGAQSAIPTSTEMKPYL